MKHLSRIVALGGLALLGACATPADPTRMSVTPTAGAAGMPERLHNATCVRTVTGGEDTNPLWVSKVDDAGFRTALTASLRNAALLADGSSCAYPIDVNLLGLAQPSMGFDLTVTAHVNYKMYDVNNTGVLLETISTPYTATFSESPIAFIRLQRANEGAIRASINEFLDRLRRL